MQVATLVTPALLSCVLLFPSFAPVPDPELAQAEKQLRDHHIDTDGPSLLRYLAARTLGPADRGKIAALIRDLGDDNFEVRQQASERLIRWGRPVMASLRQALTDNDVERTLRTERCLEAIDDENDVAQTETVIRLLTARQPAGSIKTLLAFLVDCPDESTVWLVRQSLVDLARPEDVIDPDLVAGLANPQPVSRAATAYALGRTMAVDPDGLRPLLKDKDVTVRFEAALALARLGERDGIPTLIALLEEAPSPLAWQAHDLLLTLAGNKAPTFQLVEDQAASRKARAAWSDWWQANGAGADLARLRGDGPALQGVNVILEIGDGFESKVWACRADGREAWGFGDCQGACHVSFLPNDHLLIAEVLINRVTERDHTGKILWTVAVTNPTASQRLPNGNTFIATYHALLEVNPEGKTVASFKNPTEGMIFRARRLPNGHTVFLSSAGKIVELDSAGAKVRIIDLGFGGVDFGGVEPLPDGRFLVFLRSQNLVFEVDSAGRRSHEIKVPNPNSALRLPNGHTLVASGDGLQVLEYNAAGQEVWKQQTKGRVIYARRY